MQAMDVQRITMIHQAGASSGATYTYGDKSYELPAFMTDYGCCNCFYALDGFFCKHQLLALQVHTLGHGEVSPKDSNKFVSVCVKHLGTTFGSKGGCTPDCIAPVINALTDAFGARGAVRAPVEKRAPTVPLEHACAPCMATAAERELELTGTAVASSSAQRSPPPLPQAAPVIRHSPATKALRQGSQPSKSLFGETYDRLLSPSVPHHVRQKWVPQFESMISRMRLDIDARVPAVTPVPQFQPHVGSLSEKRLKAAGEKGRKRSRAPAPTSAVPVADFIKTATVEYNESRKLPQTMAGRVDRAASAAEARLDPVEAAASIPKSAVATGRRLMAQAAAARLAAAPEAVRHTGPRALGRRRREGQLHGPWDGWGDE